MTPSSAPLIECSDIHKSYNLGLPNQAEVLHGLTQRRRTTLGFVFQFHHLLPAFTALENVTLPALMREGLVTPARRAHALAVLKSVGLEDASGKRPGELSGGMQQRVAIARALLMQPPLVLADEPTGNLDTQSADEVFDVMRRVHADLNVSFLVVTHDPRLAARCDRVIELIDGRIARDQPVRARSTLEHPDETAA